MKAISTFLTEVLQLFFWGPKPAYAHTYVHIEDTTVQLMHV